MARTKIVCTIGPTSQKLPMLKKLIRNGLNVARLNFSHGDHASHRKLFSLVNQAAKAEKKTVAIIGDLQGPRIRIGDIGKVGLSVKPGDKVIVTTGETAKGKLPITYDRLHRDISAGERILIMDGLIALKVDKVKGRDIHCSVVVGGLIETHKGVNLPDTKVSLSSLTAKDKLDVEFCVKLGVDFFALSFVRKASDVLELRNLIKKFEKKYHKSSTPIKIIVKLERREAIDNLDSILAATDAVMVARGDLGVELPAEEVPLLQKKIVEKCLAQARPVIVATQMLESMIQNPRPTRAEASDVANAVIDHADALMLSGETANGKYPAEAVDYMRKIIEKTEASAYDDVNLSLTLQKYQPLHEAIGQMASLLASTTRVKLIAAISGGGKLGLDISRFRPELPIVVVCPDVTSARQMQLSWSAVPIVQTKDLELTKMMNWLVKEVHKRGLVKKNDNIVIVSDRVVEVV